ncbi:MAG: tRNA lysidine(34) synthetase TilS [Muribaculaceae bacterium]|nr:tRNA lysidine(34) synthetase TilS [Muribaculaceae bacterium]
MESARVRSVLVAVSGGADSVALLCACTHVAPLIGLHVEAANCNFHLRGEESDRDSAFTAELCERLGIRLHRLEYIVSDYMDEHLGLSTEMACRELRYADFFRICREERLERVAVAHNADDDIETMMLAFLRGSGSRGLRGMDIDNGSVIRPLLGVSRSEIEEYLSAIGQEFVIDSSNLTSDYRRNFLRHDIIPLLKSRWQGARKSLARTLSIMKEESEIIEEHYRKQIAQISPQSNTLLVYADGVKTGTVLRFLEPFGGNHTIAEEIMESIGKDFCQRSWRLSDRYMAILERDRLIIEELDRQQYDPSVKWERFEMKPELMTEIKSNRSHDVIYLPHSAEEYDLRRPKTGDRIAPLGMKGTRLVSDIISDAKLDHYAKEAVRVLVRRSDGEIIWVTGLKRSRHDLVSPKADFIYKAVYNY